MRGVKLMKGRNWIRKRVWNKRYSKLFYYYRI